MNFFEKASERTYLALQKEDSMEQFIRNLSNSINYIEKQAATSIDDRARLTDSLLGQMHAYLKIFKEIAEDVNRSS